ncbi:DUF11 domain-containing protein [Spirosoma linguale]|uniref:Conserved repeat domain protein n=1 Tax=Spirosoma linguale (strain ATCC 33905 / DSM 74 / LMG 10896 / Claus 1) TaxID=504472 RepID=D2QKK1_SPILD|nr:conserved repeat domain protein [Spirosoma linguale DSM 74]
MSFLSCCRLTAGLVLLLQPLLVFPQNQPRSTPQDTIRLLAEEEQRRLMDPATGTVPYERLDAARQQLNNRAVTANGGPVAQSGIPNITWQERGPSNLGGRTRALLFDPNDPTRKKVWAGSMSGGLWYTNDITDTNAGWTPVSDTWENMVVTALAADPSNPQVMYAGTGDMFNYVTGGGIWKTTNGGTTWTRLSNTIPGGNPPALSYSFGYIQRIVINSSGQVFAATRIGVVRSADGGTTWQYALAPNQGIGLTGSTGNYNNDLATDLELGTDGILYAGFNPNRLFRSTNTAGTSWTEITPAGASGGERTELALAPSTSGTNQVIYAVLRAYNGSSYYQDIKWFKKSSNAGVTWTDVQIPVFSWGDHFTSSNGYYSMNLVVHPTDANTLYAGGYNWFRSVDGGNSWSVPLTNTYTRYQALLFQPGSTLSAAFCSDIGISWSSNWNDVSQTQPTILDKNNGYRVNETNSVAMKSSPGSAYLLGTSRSGAFKLTANGLSAGSIFYTYSSDMGPAFIDEETPGSQLFTTSGGSVLSYDGSNYQFITGLTSVGGVADYDSPLNTLYIADYNYTTSQYFLRKVTGIGSSITTALVPLTGMTNSLSYLKLSKDRTALFAGSYPNKLYKITNLDQASPTVMAIDNGAFPQYTTVACIDIGATDNELLVTLSNFGVQSVWYTNDGGQSWVGKDQSNYGLPDVPVRAALFNPQNRKQVLLGTDAGIWSTTDITATNPGWAFSSTGMGTFRVNQLKYRSSDGRVAAAIYGRGIWTTDAFATPYTAPTIAITSISNSTLCAGNTFSVAFSTAGPAFNSGNTFEVWLSDAMGNFTNAQKIGSGTSSPITATLPSGYNAVPYGTSYQVKIMSTNPDIESSPSGILAIGNLRSAETLDRLAGLSTYFSSYGIICPGSRATLKTYAYSTNYSRIEPTSYQWLVGSSPISGATSATISVQQAGTYSAVVKQAGCTVTSYSYILAVSTNPYNDLLSDSYWEPQCDDHPLKLTSIYPGETAQFQWSRDGVDIAGATSYTYNASQTGSYSYRFTDGSCAVTSSKEYVQFGRALSAPIYLSWNSDSLLCSSATNYNAAIYTNIPPANDYTVQWYRDGTIISGATSRSYYPYQPGVYSMLLKQGSCQTRSNAIVISQSDQIKASIIYSYPSKAACPGETRYLYAFPSNDGSFQWQKDGVDIAGATSSSYPASVSGKYTVRITKGSCSATSDPVSLTFSTTIQPVITIAESNMGESCTGANPYVSDSYNQSGYQYQWYRNGTLLNGTTNSGFYTTQSGVYSVRVTNGSCTGLSKDVYLSIGNGSVAKPKITITPMTRQLCLNNSLFLFVRAYSGNLQWKRNGVNIPQATSYGYDATQSGIYSVVLQDGSCSAESDPVEVKIGEVTTATLSGNALITSGQSAKLPVSFSGPAPWSVTLTNGQSVTATYQNPTLISVSPTSNTTYQLASVINACGTGTTSGQASVSVGIGSADVSLNMAASNRSPKVGDVVNYTLSATNAGPDNAEGIQLSSLLPAGLAFVGSASPGVSAANGVISANLGTIPANSQSAISFLATPTLPGTFATTAQITSSLTPDPDSQPNSGTGDGQDDAVRVDLRTTSEGGLVSSPNPNQTPLPVVAPNQPATGPNTADLSLAMRVDKLTPTSSNLISTSLTVSNGGGSSASSIVVQVVLPNGVALPASQSGWVQVDGQTFKGYINQLASGQSATLVLNWQATGSGTLKAQILDMNEADPDSTPGNGFSKGEDDEAAISLRLR